MRAEEAPARLNKFNNPQTTREYQESEARYNHLVTQRNKETGVYKLDLHAGTQEDLQGNILLLQRQVGKLQRLSEDCRSKREQGLP